MNKEELSIVIEKHKLWLDNKDGGERANLVGANLAGARLVDARLDGANLAYANLRGANLAGANLDGAKLAFAKLSYANLDGANLAFAKLSYANLAGAKIHSNYTIKNNLYHLSNVGSENGTLIIADCEEGWYFNRGCFKGGKDEFLKAVEETHGDNKHGKFYKKIVEVYTEVSE